MRPAGVTQGSGHRRDLQAPGSRPGRAVRCAAGAGGLGCLEPRPLRPVSSVGLQDRTGPRAGRGPGVWWGGHARWAREILAGSHECWGGWQGWTRNESVPVTGMGERRQAQS